MYWGFEQQLNFFQHIPLGMGLSLHSPFAHIDKISFQIN